MNISSRRHLPTLSELSSVPLITYLFQSDDCRVLISLASHLLLLLMSTLSCTNSMLTHSLTRVFIARFWLTFRAAQGRQLYVTGRSSIMVGAAALFADCAIIFVLGPVNSWLLLFAYLGRANRLSGVWFWSGRFCSFVCGLLLSLLCRDAPPPPPWH